MAVAAPRKRQRRKNYNESPLWVYLLVGSLVSAVFVVPLIWPPLHRRALEAAEKAPILRGR